MRQLDRSNDSPHSHFSTLCAFWNSFHAPPWWMEWRSFFFIRWQKLPLFYSRGEYNSKSCEIVWNHRVADWKVGEQISHAPRSRRKSACDVIRSILAKVSSFRTPLQDLSSPKRRELVSGCWRAISGRCQIPKLFSSLPLKEIKILSLFHSRRRSWKKFSFCYRVTGTGIILMSTKGYDKSFWRNDVRREVSANNRLGCLMDCE